MYYAICKDKVAKLATRSATLAFIAKTGRDEIKEIYKMPRGWRCVKRLEPEVMASIITRQGTPQDIHFSSASYNAMRDENLAA